MGLEDKDETMNRISITLISMVLLSMLTACGDTVGSGDSDPAQVDSDQGTPVDELTYSVIDTGQERCYSTSTAMTCGDQDAALGGQDAQYQGIPFDLIDNGDGTVTDRNTRLMWQQAPGEKMTWEEAMAAADTFELAGYDDWRLPTIQELYSLMDFRGVDPSGYSGTDTSGLVPFIDDEVFDFAWGDPAAGERIIDSQWATSTLYVAETMRGAATMFGVNFADGRIKGYGTGPMPGQTEGKGFFAVFVRGGDGYGINDFEDRGDDTVLDYATGLMWQQSDSGDGLDWEEALDYCEDLELAGHDDWRLPNAKELHSIVDYTRSPATTDSAAIDPIFEATEITNEAGEPDYAAYWTSTTHANFTGDRTGAAAAYITFGRAMGYMNGAWLDVHGAGAQRSDPKTGDPSDYPTGNGPQGDAIRIYNHVRCVRLGAMFESSDPGTGGEEPECGDFICDPSETTSCPQDCESGPSDPGTGGPGGPVDCDVQADCEKPGVCPPDAALGCTCAPGPEGGNACIPACSEDRDCPSPPDMTLTCSPEGVCVPG